MIVLDNFIEDEELINNIKHFPEFWEEGYSWWGGWWNNSASTLRHQLIEKIWTDYRMPSMYINGFEHWTGILSKDKVINNGAAMSAGMALNLHFDKDEQVWDKTGEVRSPKLGTVYYPPMGEQCEGGHLKIYDTHEIDTTAPYELIAPKHNRLVVFDAGKLHGVTGITKGDRYSVAINLWDELTLDDMKEVL